VRDDRLTVTFPIAERNTDRWPSLNYAN